MNTITVVSQDDFAREVQTDRLSLLWRVTLVSQLALLCVVWLTVQVKANTDTWILLGALLSVIVGCLLTGRFLQRSRYYVAAWCYIAGFILAIAALLYGPPGLTRNIVPFTFPLLIFIAGLLLPPRTLFVMFTLAAVVIFGVPMVFDNTTISALTDSQAYGNSLPYQWVALLFTLIASLLTAQASGELYAIAEWALSQYRAERRRKLELHQSQLDLTKTLVRAQVLAEDLETTNVELAQANIEMEQARAAAEEAKNFRGQFLANMSHELRTPLNAVIGFSDTMLNFPGMYDNIPLPGEYSKDMEQVYSSGTQLLHVINDILDLSKVDVGKLELHLKETHLLPIFKATLSMAVALIGNKPIELFDQAPADLPLVLADANRVRQVLLNLYSNATKYTRGGHITLNAMVSGKEIIISVTDSGSGIPLEEREFIFEEFQQGRAGIDHVQAGTGLGLTISRHLVELMHGRIWFESEPGVGSAFYFTLPCAHVEQAPALEEIAPPVFETLTMGK